MPPPITNAVTFVYTRDLVRASAFLEDVLELPLAVDQGSCRIHRTAPNGFIGVCDLPERPQSPVGVTLTLVMADRAAVDAYCSRLKAKGVSFEREPKFSERFRVYAALLLSPDGHRIEVQCFEDGSGLSQDQARGRP